MNTFDGSEPGPTPGHVGLPVNWWDVLERVQRGLPVYCPADPKPIDQAPYLRWAEERGPNSA